MRAVLFVDDEPSILDGLRSALRKERTRWDMTFVSSGPAALEALEQQPHDVIVSDMRMPGMDGAQLLRLVRERHAPTARVILTGQASTEDLIRALPVAQQVLSKPCDRAILCDTIERLFKVQALLSDQRIHALIGSLESLPIFPKCYHELSQAMLHEQVSVEHIVRLVEKDPALSVTALSIANGYFGHTQPTNSIAEAVGQIGFQLLRSLALSSDMFSRVDGALMGSQLLIDLPRRSLLKAQLARRFVSEHALKEEAFAAGLLLGIGHIVLAQSCADTYIRLLEQAQSDNARIRELEQAQFGFTYAEAGAYFLGMWGLPARLVELVACHHTPGLLALSHNPVAAAVHAADVLVDGLWAGEQEPLAAIVPAIRDRPEVAARLADWQMLAQELVGRR